jgi:integrase
MADNLIQKRGESTWYVKLSIPVDVRSILGGKTVFVRSLQTGLRSEAMERRLAILAEWKAAIAQARAKRTARGDAWKDPVAVAASDLALRARELKTQVVLGEEDQNKPALSELKSEFTSFTGIPELAARQDQANRVFAIPGIDGELAKIGFAKEVASAMLVRQFGKLHELSPAELAEAQLILTDPKAHKPKSPITTSRLKAFREFRERRGGAPKHVDQQVRRMEDLSAFLKDNSLLLEFDSIDAWIKSLNRAPATLSQYLMSGTAFWSWAIRYDAQWRVEYEGKTDPFKRHELPKGGGRETAGEKREAYTVTELEKLHKAARDAGNMPLADLILMGAYTGCRIEQLCRLRKEHIIEEDGVLSFNFLKGKNEQARRIVPVHPALKAVIERLIRDSSDEFLIPATENLYQKRSHGLSREFGKLKEKQGFGPLHVFHSMRNTVITAMLRADVPDYIVQEIVGHTSKSVTHAVYSRGASAQQKFDAIAKLPAIPID